MVSWLSKRVGPPTISLKSVEEQKKFQSDNPIVVYGYFKSDVADKEYDVYKNVAENFEEIKFAILDSDEILQEFGIDGDKYVALQVSQFQTDFQTKFPYSKIILQLGKR